MRSADDQEADRLDGGGGFDSYYVGDGDTVIDSDGSGEVHFLPNYYSSRLSANEIGSKILGVAYYNVDGKHHANFSDQKLGVGFSYDFEWVGADLKITCPMIGASFTIMKFKNHELGIHLLGGPSDGGGNELTTKPSYGFRP